MSTELEAASRLAHLVALCIAPSWLSPDPAPAGAAHAVLSLLAVVASLVAAARFRRSLDGGLGRYAAAAWWVAIAAALGATLYFRGDNAPLGRAVPFVAPIVWGALALAAAAAAERFLRKDLAHRAAIAGVATLVVGGVLVGIAWPLLRSPERMWERALELEPAHEHALVSVARDLADRRKHQEAIGLADRCVEANRASCTCQAVRVISELRLHQIAPALERARAAVAMCDGDAYAHASLAQALALAADHQAAMVEVTRALTITTPGQAQSAIHFAHALALDGLGRKPEALREAELAVTAGGGRDARMLAAAMAIGAGELELAARHVDAQLAADPNDPDAIYNRALIADKRNDFNRAREGYLATLKLEPAYAAARYNVALLTWRYGIREEAKSHVRRFVEAYPGDPRGGQLLVMVGEAPRSPPYPEPQ